MYKKTQGRKIFLLSIYVDDIIYTSSSLKMIKEFKVDMTNTFDMSDLSLMNYFWGLEVKQMIGGTFITQRKYVSDFLTQLGMANYNPEGTPIGVNEKHLFEENPEKADARTFSCSIRKLLYITHTSPDVCFAVNLLRFLSNPSKQH